MKDHSFREVRFLVTTTFQADFIMAVMMSFPILYKQKVIPRWSVKTPLCSNVKLSICAHFTRFADGPGIRVVGFWFWINTARSHKFWASFLRPQRVYGSSGMCWSNVVLWVKYFSSAKVIGTPWIRLVTVTNDCMGCFASYLSTRLAAVGAASHPCNVDGQTPPMIKMLCQLHTMANVLFCLIFQSLDQSASSYFPKTSFWYS